MIDLLFFLKGKKQKKDTDFPVELTDSCVWKNFDVTPRGYYEIVISLTGDESDKKNLAMLCFDFGKPLVKLPDSLSFSPSSGVHVYLPQTSGKFSFFLEMPDNVSAFRLGVKKADNEHRLFLSNDIEILDVNSIASPRSGRPPFQLALTFDVKNMKSRDPVFIEPQGMDKPYGVYYIMGELEKRSLKGVFFVNVYEYVLYEGFIESLIADMVNRGHEVGLQFHNPEKSHTEWTPLALPFYKDHISEYSYKEKRSIIRYGIDFIEEHTGKKPVSVRGGTYYIDDDLLKIFSELGFRIDSSYWHGNKHFPYAMINAPGFIHGCLEFPVTSFGSTEKNVVSRFDVEKFQSAGKLNLLLTKMMREGYRYGVFTAQSHAFFEWTEDLKEAMSPRPFQEKKYAKGISRKKAAAFEGFLDFAQKSPVLKVVTFNEIDTDNIERFEGEKDGVIPTGVGSARPFLKHGDVLEPVQPEQSDGLSRKLKRVVIHIGMTGTGSSAIQRFLNLNRGGLESEKIIVPPTTFEGIKSISHQWVFFAFSGKDSGKHRGNLKAALSKLIEKTDNGSTLILSSEAMYHDYGEDSIQELAHFLRKYTKDVSIVVYLQRIDLHVANWYAQNIEMGNYQTVAQIAQSQSSYDFCAKLDRWAAVFGDDSIVVRRYERDVFDKKNVAADFCKILRIKYGKFKAANVEEKASLSARSVQLLRHINAYYKKSKREPPASYQAVLKNEFPGKPFALSHEVAVKMIMAHKSGHDAVAERFLGDDELFPIPRKNGYVEPEEDLSVPEAIELWCALHEALTGKGESRAQDR